MQGISPVAADGVLLLGGGQGSCADAVSCVCRKTSRDDVTRKATRFRMQAANDRAAAFLSQAVDTERGAKIYMVREWAEPVGSGL